MAGHSSPTPSASVMPTTAPSAWVMSFAGHRHSADVSDIRRVLIDDREYGLGPPTPRRVRKLVKPEDGGHGFIERVLPLREANGPFVGERLRGYGQALREDRDTPGAKHSDNSW